MPNPATLLRASRRRAGLTQRQLALRLGVSQAAIAKLERPGANPTFETLAGAVWATGHRLELEAPARRGGVDEGLVRRQLELSPSERMRELEAMHAQARALALAGARGRGEHT